MYDLRIFAVLLFGINSISIFSFLEVVIIIMSSPDSLYNNQHASLPIVIIIALVLSLIISDNMYVVLKQFLEYNPIKNNIK